MWHSILLIATILIAIWVALSALYAHDFYPSIYTRSAFPSGMLLSFSWISRVKKRNSSP